MVEEAAQPEAPMETGAETPQVPEDLRGVDPAAIDPKDTDFARLLRDDVPDDLRNAALRKLWESDETLANLDGLNDYDENFTTAGVKAAALEFFRRSAQWLAEHEDNDGKAPVASHDGTSIADDHAEGDDDGEEQDHRSGDA